jgi:hypothetical protein
MSAPAPSQSFGSMSSTTESSNSAASPPPPPPLIRPAAPEVKSMSLAAGGKIKQTINADPYPPSQWDTSSSIFFNVQLLNAEAFMAVTGRAPPDEPIPAATYAKHNMPFYDIWNEELTGIKGAFGNVKSIVEIDEAKAQGLFTNKPQSFWDQMKGLGAGALPKQRKPFKGEDSIKVPIVMLDMGRKRTFRPLKDLEAELARLSVR